MIFVSKIYAIICYDFEYLLKNQDFFILRLNDWFDSL